MTRGGKRQGAGRPKGSTTNPTVVVRVPEEYWYFVKYLPDLIETIHAWELDSHNKTSPRYDKVKQMIRDLTTMMGFDYVYHEFKNR